MLIIGILLVISGIGVGITDKEYGAMATGIVLGAFLIWYSPKAKAKAKIKKQDRKKKAMQKLMDSMDDIDNSLTDIEKSLNEIDNYLINNEKIKKDEV